MYSSVYGHAKNYNWIGSLDELVYFVNRFYVELLHEYLMPKKFRPMLYSYKLPYEMGRDFLDEQYCSRYILYESKTGSKQALSVNFATFYIELIE